jgi:hypothetical protein
LEFAPTQPVELHPGAELDASSGSLAPIIEPVGREQKRTGRFTFLPLAVIATTACAAWLLWVNSSNQRGLSHGDVTSRLRLPGDPSLGADPISDEIQRTPIGSAASFPILVRSGRAWADRPSHPASATDVLSPSLPITEGQPKRSVQESLSEAEIQFRAARYRKWLRDQGLHRLDHGEARDTAKQPEAPPGRQGVTEDEPEEQGATE